MQEGGGMQEKKEREIWGQEPRGGKIKKLRARESVQ